MRLKDGFVLRQVADTWVVLPLLEASVNFNGMLTLNESGAILWKALEQDGNRTALVNALTSEYNVSVEMARKDVDAFLDKLQRVGCLEW